MGNIKYTATTALDHIIWWACKRQNSGGGTWLVRKKIQSRSEPSERWAEKRSKNDKKKIAVQISKEVGWRDAIQTVSGSEGALSVWDSQQTPNKTAWTAAKSASSWLHRWQIMAWARSFQKINSLIRAAESQSLVHIRFEALKHRLALTSAGTIWFGELYGRAWTGSYW